MVPRHRNVTVEEVFANFKNRRAGIIKALTIDTEEFYEQCDPEKENLCLFGWPNEEWEVRIPFEKLPSNIPAPAIGINIARDRMQEKEWLTLVAAQSESWLISLAFHLGSLWNFGQDERTRLFSMINDLPTLFEIVTGTAKIETKKSSVSNHSSNKSNPSSKERVSEVAKKSKETPKAEDKAVDEEDYEENGETLCGVCGAKYTANTFWICCDICETWFHGMCVTITPARAERKKRYKCPFCINEKAKR